MRTLEEPRSQAVDRLKAQIHGSQFLCPEQAYIVQDSESRLQLEGLLGYLTRRGYAVSAIEKKIRDCRCFCAWLAEAGERERGISREMILRHLAETKYPCDRQASLFQFMEFLIQTKVIVHAVQDQSASDVALELYKNYMSVDEGLAPATVYYRVAAIRNFIRSTYNNEPPDFSNITAGLVVNYLCTFAAKHSPAQTQIARNSLSSFLLYLFRRGVLDRDLRFALPCIAKWRLASLPRYISEEEVRKIVHTCDLNKSIGRRNYAILLLMALLGLRNGEVAGLNLEDICWETGKICVRGKGTVGVLPLPPPAARAISVYLQRDRPTVSSRRVFLSARAPHVAFYSGSAVGLIVSAACRRAGIKVAKKGGHLLRHTLATCMLKNGATLQEIGTILRHRSPDTTAIYAKVDTQALRSVASPWISS